MNDDDHLKKKAQQGYPVEKKLFELEVQLEELKLTVDRLESEIDWLKENKMPRFTQRTRRR